MSSMNPREFLTRRHGPTPDFDRLFRGAFQPTFEAAYGIPLDVYETGDEIVIKAVLPGIDPEDLDVKVLGNTLTIKGEIKQDSKSEGRNYLVRERRYGSFSRSIIVPDIDAAEATAQVENGVVTLTLPKRVESRTRSIKVATK